MKQSTDPVIIFRDMVDKFQIIQLNGGKVGATMPDVDALYVSALHCALKNQPSLIPKNQTEWKLNYTNRSDVAISDPEKIAKQLTDQTHICVEYIKSEYKNKPVLFALGKVVRDFYGD